MPKIKAPAGTDSCSWNGDSFETDDEGYVDVPAEAIADLQSHGFVVDAAALAANAAVQQVKGKGKR